MAVDIDHVKDKAMQEHFYFLILSNDSVVEQKVSLFEWIVYAYKEFLNEVHVEYFQQVLVNTTFLIQLQVNQFVGVHLQKYAKIINIIK